MPAHAFRDEGARQELGGILVFHIGPALKHLGRVRGERPHDLSSGVTWPKPLFRFDFAISYAGEEEGIARDLHRLLTERGARVFLAANEKVYLLGKKLGRELPRVFGPDTRFAVPLVSSNYVKKFWPRREFEFAKQEEEKRGFEFVLPVRLDDSTLPGLSPEVVYVNLRKEGLRGTADLMMSKLAETPLQVAVPTPTQWVAAFGVNTSELLEEGALPDDAPGFYPQLCDWLQRDLHYRLSHSSLKSFKFTEDARSGETFTLRAAFPWNPEDGQVDFGDLEWWELLELLPYSEVYLDP